MLACGFMNTGSSGHSAARLAPCGTFNSSTEQYATFPTIGVVSYQAAEPNAERKTADIARKAKVYTVLISCTSTESRVPRWPHG
jgi:hypothetical protein